MITSDLKQYTIYVDCYKTVTTVISLEPVVLTGFVFASTAGKVKIELLEDDKVVLSAFSFNQTMEFKLPSPTLFKNIDFRVTSLSGPAADAYFTCFTLDPYKVFSRQFDNDFQEVVGD